MIFWVYLASGTSALLTFMFFSDEYVWYDRFITQWTDDEIPFIFGTGWDTSFLILGVLGAFCYFSWVGMKAYLSVNEADIDLLPLLFLIVVVYLLFHFFHMYHDWVLPKESNFFAMLAQVPLVLLKLVAGLYVLAGYLVAPFVVPLGVLLFTPYALLGVFSIFITSNTAKVAEKHVKATRPNNQIEMELAKAMKSGLQSDVDLHKLINEMTPVPRFLHTLTYRRKAEKYREMRKLMDSQIEASHERKELGKSAHKLEVNRRNE